ncbi:NnrS family protein [Paralimibaculum aggregatum]|uniref:NnrS family protein n=1 Tax=Paralimibaculum aggregatum TaxID=3036245 RepID=A0ABQ6LMF8_9RHOB|nr:NnrS family protein [Limibaculum sp. NKW23]GMG84392.1 NnrS family protein [Limibaculum sp. NKW23]
MMGPLRIVFGEAFRVFFLAAALFAVAAMVYWEVWLGVHAAGGMVTRTAFAPPPHHWHAHEMIYGYGAAVLGGFFLTAVPNWTGGRTAPLPFLAAVAGLWLLGRAAVWASGGLAPWLVAIADLAFAPALGLRLALMLARRPKPQNLMVLALLAIFWSGNLAVHLDWTGVWPGAAEAGLRAGLLTLTALIAVIGGRIIPAFTTNAMRKAGRETGLPRTGRRLDAPAVAAAILLPLLLLAGAPEPALAGAAGATGLLALLRLAGWRGWWTRHAPILWTMHLAYLLLGLGYLALAAAQLGLASEVGALHLLAIGGIGGMTLTVMTRAGLGHSGRPLAAPPAVVAGFLCLLGATGLRALASFGSLAAYYPATLGAGALWITAFALFLTALWEPLTTARPDRAGG